MPDKANKKKKIQTTAKKQKFIGYKTLIDSETGEAYPMQINVVEERDFNFHKIWFQHFVNGLDGIVNQKLRIAFWIIDNLNKENQLIMTQRAISDETGISPQTVNRTIQALCEADENEISFLQKINHGGSYRVNPNIIFKGSYSNRMGICFQYNKTTRENTKPAEPPPINFSEEPTPNDEIAELKEQIKFLQEQLKAMNDKKSEQS